MTEFVVSFKNLMSLCRLRYLHGLQTAPWVIHRSSFIKNQTSKIGQVKSTEQFHTFSPCCIRGVRVYDTNLTRRPRRKSVENVVDDIASDPSTIDDLHDDTEHVMKAKLEEEEKSLKPPSRRLLKNILENAATFDEVPPMTEEDVWSSGRYPPTSKHVENATKRLQYTHAIVPAVDPEKTYVILFPGQGAQFPGMGKSLLQYPNVKRLYNMASEILQYDLLDMCLHGDRKELSRTIYCQPATVVTSLAALEKLKDERPHVIENCTATAGFSVGEITALIFAGGLDFETGIKLVRIRAEAMQVASEMGPGGMMTVFFGADGKIGFACEAAKDWCIKHGIEKPECVVANYLFPGCKVLSGHEEALKFIANNAKDFKIQRFKRLNVGGAFHSNMMSPAMDVIQEALHEIEIRNPIIPVYSNVDGKPHKHIAKIKKYLSKQVCAPVKWEQTLHVIYGRPQGTPFPTTYECGPGHALRTILEKVNVKAYDKSYYVEV